MSLWQFYQEISSETLTDHLHLSTHFSLFAVAHWFAWRTLSKVENALESDVGHGTLQSCGHAENVIMTVQALISFLALTSSGQTVGR